MERIKISFFISLKAIDFIDLSTPENGNPGIGATQYLFVLLASQLTLKYDKNIDVYFMTDCNCKLPSYLKVILVEDVFDAISKAKKLDNEFLIIRTVNEPKIFEHIDNVKQKVIIWSHNRIWGDTANLIANCKYIVRNICVGARQALEIVDHEVYNKTEVILNPIISDMDIKRNLKTPTVTYIGNMDKSRGFHLLAKIWKDILKEVPDAQLNVIGSALLYNRDIKTGSLGIASEKYERRFLKYITDKNGKLLPSVHFLGLMGQDKTTVFIKSYVGVINPTGYEALPVSGLEMEACGVPLVTANKYGQSEVVLHQHTGYLFNNERQFKKYIVKLLKDKSLNINFGENAKKFISKKYDLDKILELWILEFEKIINGLSPEQKEMMEINKTVIEKIRILNSKIRRIKIFKWVPSLLEIRTLLRRCYYFIRGRILF